MPVRGSSSVGTGTSSSGTIVEFSPSEVTGSGVTFVSLSESTAPGLAGALRTGLAFLRGLGVTNSLSAPAPSMIVEPDVPIAA